MTISWLWCCSFEHTCIFAGVNPYATLNESGAELVGVGPHGPIFEDHGLESLIRVNGDIEPLYRGRLKFVALHIRPQAETQINRSHTARSIGQHLQIAHG